MAPSVKITLRNETIAAIQNGDQEKEGLLLEDIENANDLVIHLLKNYEGEKDHRGQVHSYDEIDSLEIDANGEGGFTICFPINVYSGCRDINEDFDEEMYVEIEVDFNDNSALLTGDELMPQRDPDIY